MKIIITILLLLLSQNNYEYKNSIPTKDGIANYVNENKDNIVQEFELFVGQKFFDYNIVVDDLSEYHDYDSLEAGRYYQDFDIIISNELKYLDYELSFMPKYKQKQYGNNNKFVKAVIIHELSHLYFNEVKLEMQEKGMLVHNDYHNMSFIPKNLRIKSNADFIEEGICEYIVCKMKQSICDNNYKPKNIEEIKNVDNQYLIKYIYSRIYLTEFLNTVGLKQGLLIILSNEPPNNTEILYPELYFGRIGFRNK
jgi:hypothetical protein